MKQICQVDEDSPKASISSEKNNMLNNKLLAPAIDPLFNATINNLFQIKEKLGNGSFGVIYRAVSTHPATAGASYACKVEKITSKVYQQLPTEYRILQILHENISHPAIGFSHCHYFSSNAVSAHNILVMDLLGPNLEQCLRSAKCRKLSLKTVLMLADQILMRIQHLHSKEFLHRDIKPENILVGVGDKDSRVYLVDFGLSKKYLRHDGKHIEFKDGKNLTGTARYSSLNTHLGLEQSRRDDMESIAYVLIYLAKGKLPWMKIAAADKREKYQKIQMLKETISEAALCEGLPQEFGWFLKYTRQLEFAEKPDYEKCREWFKSLIGRCNYENDGMWDWKEGNAEKGKQQMQLQLQQQQQLLQQQQQQQQELAKMLAERQLRQIKEGEKGKQLGIESRKEGDAIRLAKQMTEFRQLKMIPQDQKFQPQQGVECIAVECNNSLRMQPPMKRDTNSPYNRIPGSSRPGQKAHRTKPKDGILLDKNKESNITNTLGNKNIESRLNHAQISAASIGISQQPIIGYSTQTTNRQLGQGKQQMPTNEKELPKSSRELPQEYLVFKSQGQLGYPQASQQQLNHSEQQQKQYIAKSNIDSLTNSNIKATNTNINNTNLSTFSNFVNPSDLSTSMYTSQKASIYQQFQQKSLGEIQNLGTSKLENFFNQGAFLPPSTSTQTTPHWMLGQVKQQGQEQQQQQILQLKSPQQQEQQHLTRTEGNERANLGQQKEYFFPMQYMQQQPRRLADQEQQIAYPKQQYQEKQLLQTQQTPQQQPYPQQDQQQKYFYSAGVLASTQPLNQQQSTPQQSSQQLYLSGDQFGQSAFSMYQHNSNILSASSTSNIRNNNYHINKSQQYANQEQLPLQQQSMRQQPNN